MIEGQGWEGASLDEDAGVGGVVLLAQAEGGVDEDGEDGVHGADVVQHVAVAQHDAHHGHQEIQPPHHLHEPARAQSPPRLQILFNTKWEGVPIFSPSWKACAHWANDDDPSLLAQ